MLYYTDGIIPNIRPTRVRLPNGLTITNPDDETLFELGWKIAPPYPEYSYPDHIEWSGSDWVIVSPTQAEIDAKWENIKSIAQKKLSETDYKVLKAIEASVINGTSLEQELSPAYIAYRQALRDIYNNVNNIDPFFVQWPVLEETTNVA